MLLRRSILVAALLASACVAPPVRQPPPRPAPPAPPSPPAAAPAASWEDRVPDAGAWTYVRTENGSRASFGASATAPIFVLRCDVATRTLTVSRSGSSSGSMTLRATTGAKAYAAVAAANGMVSARLASADPQLDALAFSRGRILVGLAGEADLVLPIWPEFTHVLEDCRG